MKKKKLRLIGKNRESIGRLTPFQKAELHIAVRESLADESGIPHEEVMARFARWTKPENQS